MALAPPEEEEEDEGDNGFGGEDFQDETMAEDDFDPFGDNNGGEDYE
jgi:transcription factor IIIB subunit 2